MAFIHRRRKTKKVYAYYHDSSSGKLRQIPREQTAHLDAVPDEEVHAWLEAWEQMHGKARDRSTRINLKSGDILLALWQQYQEFKDADSDQPRRPHTIAAETALFENDIIPFFVGEHAKKDPATWHGLIPQFHLHLKKRGFAATTRQKILWTLKRFGESLVFARYMTFPFAIRPPRSKNQKITPLKARKSPEDILAYVMSAAYDSKEFRKGEIEFDLAVLIGYFGGFGPGELFALEKSDLITGDQAIESCKTYEGFKKKGLGSRLGVVVNKTLPMKGKKSKPVPLVKNDYRFGVSNIWHPAAARMIASIVKTLPDGRLFPFSYGHLVRQWREQVLPRLGVTVHDLRRASALYLGRTERIGTMLLQEHMRHAEIQTTMLYTREPAVSDEITKKKPVQDLDDVA